MGVCGKIYWFNLFSSTCKYFYEVRFVYLKIKLYKGTKKKTGYHNLRLLGQCPSRHTQKKGIISALGLKYCVHIFTGNEHFKFNVTPKETLIPEMFPHKKNYD